MKKSKMILYGTTALALLTAMPSFSFAEPITWGDDFVYFTTPSTGQCQAWQDFLDKLTPDQEYVSVAMTSSTLGEKISITDPAVVQELAYFMYKRIDGEVTSEGHTWGVYTGCTTGGACVPSAETVELRIDQENGCSCNPEGINIRPDIGSPFWGGINPGNCVSPDQTVTVEFQLAPDMTPTIMVGECDSGVDNFLLAENGSVSDKITECDANAKNHGQFVKCLSHLTNTLNISGEDKSAIMDCAASTD